MTPEDKLPVEQLEMALLERPDGRVPYFEAKIILEGLGWETSRGEEGFLEQMAELSYVEGEEDALDEALVLLHQRQGEGFVSLYRSLFVATPEELFKLREMQPEYDRLFQEEISANDREPEQAILETKLFIAVPEHKMDRSLLLGIASIESLFRRYGILH